MSLDWTKPIQFENGDPCELIETWPDGNPNFRDATRVVRRPLETNLFRSVWWFKEDGKSHWSGYSIINAPVAEQDRTPIPPINRAP